MPNRRQEELGAHRLGLRDRRRPGAEAERADDLGEPPRRKARGPQGPGRDGEEHPRGRREARRQVTQRYSIVASRSPELTGAPSFAASLVILPDLWAVISFSIFIASITQTRSPSETSWPSSTGTLKTLPCRGETRSSPEAALPPPAERSRLGARFRPAPAPAAGAPTASPITLTSKSLPPTSTW